MLESQQWHWSPHLIVIERLESGRPGNALFGRTELYAGKDGVWVRLGNMKIGGF